MKPEEHGELAATRDLWLAVPVDLAETPRVAHAEVDGALCVAVGGIPAVLVSHAMGLGLDGPATPAQLDAIAELYRPLGVSYQVAVSPDARPGYLSHVLEERGFEPGYHRQKLARGVEPPPEVETDLRIEAMGTEGAADFAQASILAARSRRGAELGCRTLVTETGVREKGRPSPSHDNIERLGFQPTYIRENWVPAARA